MVELVVTTRAGATAIIETGADMSVMEALREGGIGEILALCGGCLSCATCHVFVDPADAALVTPINEYEEELMETLSLRRPNSRLSCQMRMADSPACLRITVAPEE